MAQGYVRAADLPQVIPVFPLPGAILLPRGQLPLNLIEPRYLNMIDDPMAGDRIIGMLQPIAGSPRLPSLSPVGCAGRITSFAETSDGRYLITLTGCAR
ncbi:MAG: LON peptidase substrate-binding domain-containing protein, partial [Brevundimonas sp.]|nr:LON peptidase substrate-binding domain-containing protein [Brevundimonas sp.]